MKKNFFFKDIKILKGANMELKRESLLIIDGRIEAFGKTAEKEALRNNIKVSKSTNKFQ